MVGRSINLGDLMMANKRFKLSRFAIPSELSDFCDENGRMLNSEVVRMLNDRDKQQISNIHMFFKIKDQEATIEDQNKLIEKLRWDLNKTREDLNYFATLKVTAMKGCEPNE